MTGIGNTQYDFLGALFEAQTVRDYERLIVPFCSETFAVQSVLAMRYHRTGVPEVLFRWIPNDTLRDTFDSNYFRFGYLLDPYFKLAFEIGDWKACPLREIAPDRFETSDYYSGYFSSTEMVDEMGFVARVDNESAFHLSMGRSAGTKRFRSSETSKFKSLSKILVPALMSLTHQPSTSRATPSTPLASRFHKLSLEHGQEISSREAEVATLIVQGNSSRAIGLKLGISSNTVKVHRRNLYSKLNISSQSELFGLLTVFEESI